MRQDIKSRLKKLEDAHGSQQPPEPDDDAVMIWKFLLTKRRMNEERGRPSESPPPTLESVREYVARMARKRSADEQSEEASSAPISRGSVIQ
jgi:hypothetical protein